MIIKPLANESFCNTTPNTYTFAVQVTQNASYGGGPTITLSGVNTYSVNSNATLLRLFNSANTPFLITASVNSTVNVSSVTIAPGQEMFIEKAANNFLQSNTATGVIFCVPVAFKST
jgi:hypothetical protein